MAHLYQQDISTQAVFLCLAKSHCAVKLLVQMRVGWDTHDLASLAHSLAVLKNHWYNRLYRIRWPSSPSIPEIS